MWTGDDRERGAGQPALQPDGVQRINALLRLVRSAREDPVPEVLAAVAETVRDAAGFGAVVVNLYRREWDHYEAVLVLGSEAVRHALLGSTVDRNVLDATLFAGGYERLRGVFFIPGGADLWDHVDNSYTSDLAAVDHPDAWMPDDGLLVRLTDSGGHPLGVLSVDEPSTGMRPSDGDLQMLRAICSHAEQALEGAQALREQADNERMLAQLLRVSPTLASHQSVTSLLEAVAGAIVPDLGWERVALYARTDHDALSLCASRGWGRAGEVAAPALPTAPVEELLVTQAEEAGCWLVEARDIQPAHPDGWSSPRNGRGPAGWHDHCLLVPVRDDDGTLQALAAIEDPVDHLLPGTSQRRAIRLLLDQASSALQIIHQRERLRYLADHDPLTGVRNRRNLPEMINGFRQVSLVACDLDHFKRINDHHGHEVGDRVLERVGALLLDLAREHDIAVRLGGEEFCMVLPDTDAAGAVALAERLRKETTRTLRDQLDIEVTVSIGIATAVGPVDAERLLVEADRALYAAKRAGRDRTVASGGVLSNPAGGP